MNDLKTIIYLYGGMTKLSKRVKTPRASLYRYLFYKDKIDVLLLQKVSNELNISLERLIDLINKGSSDVKHSNLD